MSALDEIRDLLGVTVENVWTTHDPTTAYDTRPAGWSPRRWWVISQSDERAPRMASSADLRAPAELNRLANAWGRPASAPRLTARDGRRLLRLLHEHVEDNPQQEESPS